MSEARTPPPGVVPLNTWARGEDSGRSMRVSIVRESDQRCLGTALVTLAEESSEVGRLKLPRAALAPCFFISDIGLDPEAGDVLPALLYACLRRGRMWDRVTAVTMVAKSAGANNDGPGRIELAPLHHVQPWEHGGEQWTPMAQRLDLAIHRAVAASSPEMKVFLRELFVPETVETLEKWVDRFFKMPFFQSIHDGTMTREQYIYGLSNMHQFIRWTTRLCGLAVANSHDGPIRRKWIDHLRGEIDHEVIIEKDLAGLQADVDYVVKDMVPSVSVQAFMVTQESAIAFQRDPILLAAAPYVAEGFCGRLDQRFVDNLRKCAKSWGIQNPKQVTAFWASHVEFDGGDDGHWEMSRKMLELYLVTERDLQRFLNIMKLACNAFERSYTSYIEDLAILSAKPTSG